jgi:hypothetical protein
VSRLGEDGADADAELGSSSGEDGWALEVWGTDNRLLWVFGADDDAVKVNWDWDRNFKNNLNAWGKFRAINLSVHRMIEMRKFMKNENRATCGTATLGLKKKKKSRNK